MASWLYNTLMGAAPQAGDSASSKPLLSGSDSPPAYEYSSPKTFNDTKSSVPRGPRLLELPALTLLRKRRVILASASPRRKQLLQSLGLPNIEIIPSTFAEDLDKTHYTPWEYVLETATQKCQGVYRTEIVNEDKEEPSLVIGADTVICLTNGQVLEKPTSEAHHLEMLQTLRDAGSHKVFTAIVAMSPLETAVHPGYAMQQHVEETTVYFDKAVSDELLKSYVKTREGADKAGGYAIQGIGAILIEKIEGSYDNVVGLPVRSTLRLIERVMGGDSEEEEEEEAVTI